METILARKTAQKSATGTDFAWSGIAPRASVLFLGALRATLAVAAVALSAIAGTGVASADELSDIRKAGVVKFGVKVDVKPWGYVDSNGKPIGFEIDMAEALAKQLGVKMELITVTSANRIQYLEQGRINIILATMSDTPKRREVVRMIEPHYFGDATNVLAPTGTKFKTWPDIKGATLCAVSGAIYNKWVQQEYNAEVKAFKGPPEALAALQQKQCEGFIFSDQILRIMQNTEADLKNYVVALEPVNTDYWGIAVKNDATADGLAAAVSKGIATLHKSGELLKLANAHGLGGNPFLKSMANK